MLPTTAGRLITYFEAGPAHTCDMSTMWDEHTVMWEPETWRLEQRWRRGLFCRRGAPSLEKLEKIQKPGVARKSKDIDGSGLDRARRPASGGIDNPSRSPSQVTLAFASSYDNFGCRRGAIQFCTFAWCRLPLSRIWSLGVEKETERMSNRF